MSDRRRAAEPLRLCGGSVLLRGRPGIDRHFGSGNIGYAEIRGFSVPGTGPNPFTCDIQMTQPSDVSTIVSGGGDVLAHVDQGPGTFATHLLGAAPNPFTHETSIRYSLSPSSGVRVVVFDPAGWTLRTLIESTESAGVHRRVVDLFHKQDTRDELGPGVIRDSVADLTFPAPAPHVLVSRRASNTPGTIGSQ